MSRILNAQEASKVAAGYFSGRKMIGAYQWKDRYIFYFAGPNGEDMTDSFIVIDNKGKNVPVSFLKDFEMFRDKKFLW